MARRMWRRAVLAWREACLNEAVRREAGGSGLRLGIWMGASALLCLACMAWLGESGRAAGAASLAVLALFAWRDAKADGRRWSHPERARANRVAAWMAARRAAARAERYGIGESCARAKEGKGPKRL